MNEVDDPGKPVNGIGVPREVLRQVKRIELRTRGVVNSVFSGEYHSVFKGQGMEFAEVREYTPGDDVRTIDWNVTARMGHPYVKKHVEERELTAFLAVDLSGSERFGTRGRFKAELAAEIAAVLAISAVRNNDRVGLMIFTDRVEHVVPPKKGRRHVLRLIRDLLVFEPEGRGTDLTTAVDYAGRLLPHRSILFVLSDFLLALTGRRAAVEGAGAGAARSEGGASAPDADGWEAWRRVLRMASRRHDLVALRMIDAAEEALPDVGVVTLSDPETGEEFVIDTAESTLRERYRERTAWERQRMQQLFRRLGVDEVVIRTDASYIGPLLAFFRQRERQQTR